MLNAFFDGYITSLKKMLGFSSAVIILRKTVLYVIQILKNCISDFFQKNNKNLVFSEIITF